MLVIARKLRTAVLPDPDGPWISMKSPRWSADEDDWERWASRAEMYVGPGGDAEHERNCEFSKATPVLELGDTHWCIGLHSIAMEPGRVRVIMLE
jgi:hypothetical protein